MKGLVGIKKAIRCLRTTSLMASAPTLIHLELFLRGKSHFNVTCLNNNFSCLNRQATLVLPNYHGNSFLEIYLTYHSILITQRVLNQT